ncbi:MAG: HAD hydrolase family protein [Acetatifactor sp.]
MKKSSQMTLPPIGLRIVKSAVAVALCYVVSFIRGNSGIVFYSQLAALWCMQVYVSNTKQNAIQRTIGTVVGALYGLLFLLGKGRIGLTGKVAMVTDAAVISLMVVVILYTTVLMKKKQASYFSCVVFLSIVVNHMSDANPYLFVWNRFLDTMIGIIIGIGVNCFSLPKEKRKDILFVSGLDDTLLNKKELLSDYNKVELNRMLDEGIHFTVSTMRTPASLMEPLRDIRLNLPVIAMNGAVLYDIRDKKYLKSYIISPDSSQKLLALIHGQGLHCFSNVLVDDMLVIYYDETEDEVQQKLVRELRKSPYRNYVKRPVPEKEAVVYFMLLYPREEIEQFYQVLEKENVLSCYKVLKYDSTDYPGYAYIKIYNKNASREHMILYLKQVLDLQKTVTFGSIPGKYDVLVEDSDTGSMIHTLKRLYEPVKKPWTVSQEGAGRRRTARGKK